MTDDKYIEAVEMAKNLADLASKTVAQYHGEDPVTMSAHDMHAVASIILSLAQLSQAWIEYAREIKSNMPPKVKEECL